MKNNVKSLGLCIILSTVSSYSIASSHSIARSDCPHTINLDTIKLLADKKKVISSLIKMVKSGKWKTMETCRLW